MAKKDINKIIRTPKDVVVISFSGGETSAKMLIDILEENKKREVKWKIYIPFMNTGEENEETLLFVHQVGNYIKEHYNEEITWLEYAGYNRILRKHQHKYVDYSTAYRSHDPEEINNLWQNHPFRKMIEYFGIPNMKYKHCSRELKGYVCRRWLRIDCGLKTNQYTIATGIRADEIDRVTFDMWHPLALNGTTKPMVNSFWKSMPFRLQLKGYEGNCKVCWKKSDRKLCTIMREDPSKFSFFDQMQKEYEWHSPKREKGRVRKALDSALRFFRGNRTVEDIKTKSLEGFLSAEDDSIVYDEDLDINNGCEESCEAF